MRRHAQGLRARTRIKPKKLTKDRILNLRPNDLVLVYHATQGNRLPDFIYGFDANTVMPRHYNGPRHAGIFVAPTLEATQQFGSVVLEIAVKARYLHGTDYSGNIGRVEQTQADKRHGSKWSPEVKEWIRSAAPNSFRPYLSKTLSASVEPQALLRGLISPKQITRIWINLGEGAKWYTREALLNAGYIYDHSGAYKPTLSPKGDFNASYPNYTYPQLIAAIGAAVGGARDIASTVERYTKMARAKGPEVLIEMLQRQIGFGQTAARVYATKLISGTMKGQPKP